MTHAVVSRLQVPKEEAVRYPSVDGLVLFIHGINHPATTSILPDFLHRNLWRPLCGITRFVVLVIIIQ